MVKRVVFQIAESFLNLPIINKYKYLLPKRLFRYYYDFVTDGYIVSFPKCGRTWLRTLLGKTLQLHYNLPDKIILNTTIMALYNNNIPIIKFYHYQSPQIKVIEKLDISKLKNKKILFIVRDPRDVIISIYYQFTKRDFLYEGLLHSFIYDSKMQIIKKITSYYNHWFAASDEIKDFKFIRYEDLKREPVLTYKSVLSFFDIRYIPESTINEAIRFSSFDNMRRMEIENYFDGAILSPGNINDIDSYKTRKGEIGDYLNHLNSEDIDYLESVSKCNSMHINVI